VLEHPGARPPEDSSVDLEIIDIDVAAHEGGLLGHPYRILQRRDQRDAEQNLGLGVDGEPVGGGNGPHDRGDVVAEDGDVVIQKAQDLHIVLFQPDLLLRLPQGGKDEILIAGLRPSARKGDLPPMVLHGHGPLGDDHPWMPVFKAYGDEHGRFPEIVFGNESPLPVAQQALDVRFQCIFVSDDIFNVLTAHENIYNTHLTA
jgi:hypothetical protein